MRALTGIHRVELRHYLSYGVSVSVSVGEDGITRTAGAEIECATQGPEFSVAH